MCQEQMEMDWTTFTCLLSACNHAWLVGKGLQYFRAMNSVYDVVPRAEHYACVVDLLGRADRLHEAEDMIKATLCGPSVNVWKATREILRLRDPHKAVGYVMLSDIYCAAKNGIAVPERDE